MNNISITITTKDNRIQAFGYAASFYESEAERNKDVANDMTRAKDAFGDEVAIVAVAEWTDDVSESSGVVYNSLDEVIAAYPSVQLEQEDESHDVDGGDSVQD